MAFLKKVNIPLEVLLRNMVKSMNAFPTFNLVQFAMNMDIFNKKPIFIRMVLIFFLAFVIALSVRAILPEKEEPVRTVKKPPPKAVKVKKEEPPPEYFCPLCGEKVSDEILIARRPILVKVENSPSARPQSGLDKACVVYEVLTEGGITRFAAIYLSKEAESIGPVRSARFSDAILAPQYNALFAFCGGNPFTMREINDAGVDSLDEMRYGRQAYWRVKGRRAPHNLYTSTSSLRALAQSIGKDGLIYLKAFDFRESTPATTLTTAVHITYSPVSKVSYRYDRGMNSYLRFHGNTPHKDAVSGQQLTAKNVVILYAPQTVVSSIRDVAGSSVLRFGLTGEGKAVFFFNGTRVDGTWRATNSKPPEFFNGAGAKIQFSPGSIWISVVPIGTEFAVEMEQ